MIAEAKLVFLVLQEPHLRARRSSGWGENRWPQKDQDQKKCSPVLGTQKASSTGHSMCGEPHVTAGGGELPTDKEVPS